MNYDIKVFEEKEEQETIRNLRQHQVFAIASILKRHNIQYLIKSKDGKYWKLWFNMLVRVKQDGNERNGEFEATVASRTRGNGLE